MEQNSRIFISYRREDTSGYAGRLSDALSGHFGADRVFMDVDSIGYGVDFVEVIENALSSCAVMVAVIGKRWLDVTDKKGNRRLDDPTDFVHVEIAAAIRRGIRIIPALVQDAAMPGEESLPAPLAKLARRNAVEISDNRWKFDVGLLIGALEQELNKSAGQTEPAKAKEPAGPDKKPEAGGGQTPLFRGVWLKAALITLSVLALVGLAWKVLPSLTGQNTAQNQDGPPKNSASNNTTEPDAADLKYYEGTINTREQISLRLRRREQFLSGTISNYTTRRYNIQIKGSVDNAQNVVLQELDERGIETGVYRGKLSSDTIQGTWTSPQGGPEVPFYLKEVH